MCYLCMVGERHSAGVVVVRQEAEPVFLLLRAFTYWDFPKGDLALGETPLQAAVREVAEETGISDLSFPWGTDCYRTLPYARGKVASYFVGVTAAEEVRIGINPELGRPEHHEFRWLTYPQSLPLLVGRVSAVLDWAVVRITG